MVVKADFSDSYAAGDVSAKLTSLDAVDSLTSATVTLGSVPSSANLTVATASGIISSSDANPKSQLLLAGAKDQKILAFRIQAKNDTIKLSQLTFTGVKFDYLSNFRVLTPTGNYLPSTSNSVSAVTFNNLNPSDSVVADKTDTYYLVADVNTNTSGVSFSGSLDTLNSKFKSSNGNEYTLYGPTVNSNNHLINENLAVVAKSTNSSKLITTSALRFTITASGKDQITLSGASFNNLLSGYT